MKLSQFWDDLGIPEPRPQTVRGGGGVPRAVRRAERAEKRERGKKSPAARAKRAVPGGFFPCALCGALRAPRRAPALLTQLLCQVNFPGRARARERFCALAAVTHVLGQVNFPEST